MSVESAKENYIKDIFYTVQNLGKCFQTNKESEWSKITIAMKGNCFLPSLLSHLSK